MADRLRRAAFFLALCCLAFSALPARAAGEIVRHESISAAEIAFPAFSGYEEVYGRSAEFDALLEQFVPPGNRLLAVYIHGDDLKNYTADARRGFSKYILVQTLDQSVVIRDEEDFAQLRRSFIEEMRGFAPAEMPEVGDMMNNISTYISDKYKTDLRLNVGDVRNMGVIAEEDDRIGFLTLANYGVATPEGTQDYPVAAGMVAMNVRGRLVFIYAYHAQYGGQTDIDAVRDAALGFADKLQAVNAASSPFAAAGEGASDAGFWRKIAFLALAALGGLAVVMIILNYQNRKENEIK